jgi:hypothetical protein
VPHAVRYPPTFAAITGFPLAQASVIAI